jgi:4-hydroxybenzoate polyprenyltransferase
MHPLARRVIPRRVQAWTWATDGTGATGSSVQAALQLYRIRDWLHFLLLPVAAFDPVAAPGPALIALARGVVSAAALLAFGYLLNSVTDRGVDGDERKNPLIVPGAIEPTYALVLLPVVSLTLAIFAPWPVRVATVVSLTFFFIYSAAPRIKSIPVVGSLSNIGMFAPLLFLSMTGTELPPRFVYVVLALSALVLETQLVHEAADQLDDRQAGLRTTWLTLGPHWTALIVAGAGLTAAAAAARAIVGDGSSPVALAAAAVFGLIVPALLAMRGHDPAAAARLRLTTRWTGVVFGLALFVGWRWSL